MGVLGASLDADAQPRRPRSAWHAFRQCLDAFCPVCVPARASLATGRYMHEIGYWDNAIAYDGG